MAEADDKPVGRRKFLKKAAVGAAALVGQGQVVEGEEPSPTEHQHEHQTVPSDIALRVKALESVLVEKRMLDPADLDAVVDTYENKIGPQNGAQVVARAWVDPEFKTLLLADGRRHSSDWRNGVPRSSR